jgi:hypothetical protein
MDLQRFDSITRTIGDTSTRRRFTGVLAAFGLASVASLGLFDAEEADAKKRRRRNKKRRRKNRGQGEGGPVDPPTCTPNCAGKECGADGCGGTCGTCGQFQFCNAGTCDVICIPDCAGKECGDNGCGGSCGSCPILQPICTTGGLCVPIPNLP